MNAFPAPRGYTRFRRAGFELSCLNHACGGMTRNAPEVPLWVHADVANRKLTISCTVIFGSKVHWSGNPTIPSGCWRHRHDISRERDSQVDRTFLVEVLLLSTA
jgi:hypothetical protein